MKKTTYAPHAHVTDGNRHNKVYTQNAERADRASGRECYLGWTRCGCNFFFFCMFLYRVHYYRHMHVRVLLFDEFNFERNWCNSRIMYYYIPISNTIS